MNLHFPSEPAFTLNDDPNLTQIDRVKQLLDQSYWAPGRDETVIQHSIEHSVVFNIFYLGTQIGFARVVTDECTFGYFCDVIIDPQHRSKGLGRWLVDEMVKHERVKDCVKLMLKTKDAHFLYLPVGFQAAVQPEEIMERFLE